MMPTLFSLTDILGLLFVRKSRHSSKHGQTQHECGTTLNALFKVTFSEVIVLHWLTGINGQSMLFILWLSDAC